MRRPIRPRLGRNALAVLAIIAMPTCASTPANETPGTSASAVSPKAAADPAAATYERGPIGPLVRNLGLHSRRGIVLMNGLEYYQAGPYSMRDLSSQAVVVQLAADTGMKLHGEAAYDFIYPAGFEALTTFTPSAALDRRVARIETSVRLGADTPLFGALALLGHSLRLTLIADNIVAAASCGETSLHGVELGQALDAILRSARLTAATCQVESGDRTVFLSSPSAVRRPKLLANPDTTPRPGALDRRVTVYLPSRPSDPQRLVENTAARPLGDCLASLTEQMGLRVDAEARCRRLPVNPCVMSDVTVETAMRLLIQQWPVPHFGYTATEDEIRIIYLGPPAD